MSGPAAGLGADEFDGLDDEVPPRDEVVRAIRPLSSFAIVEPEYLWRPYLQRGAVNLLVGDYDMGKTWVACSVAAALSRGWHLPDARDGAIADGVVEVARTLFFTAENDPSTLRFRIDRLGGDPEHVAIWDTTTAPIPKLSDTAGLDDAFRHVRPQLAVFDPIQSALDHTRNMDKANEVRPLLDHLSALARRYSCAVLGLGHLNKATSQQAKHRIIGSIDFGAAPRSILVAAPLPSAGPHHRVLVHLKSSVSRRGTSLGYVLEGEGRTVEFTWCGAVEVDLDELLAGTKAARADSKVDEVVTFLRTLLSNGQKTRDHVIEQGALAGFSEAALKRAAGALKVKISSFGFPRRTTWSLPPWIQT